MRIAVAGVGRRSVKVLNYISRAMPEAEIVAYVDPSPKLVDQLLAAKTPRSFETVDDMLDTSDADLLFVGSPNHMHLDHIASGLRHNVQVFSEKPLVTTMDDSWALADLLKKYGADRLIVGLVLRYAPQIRDLKEQIENGHLGRIVSLEANEHIEPQHGGFFMRDWRRHSAFSGGFMLEKCCHDIDLYQMITGARALRVASFGGRKTFTPDNNPDSVDLYRQTPSMWETADNPFLSEGDIVDHQNAILQFENDVTMSFHTNINTPDESRHFCIVGTAGMAEGDLQRGYLRVTEAATSNIVFEHDYTRDPEAAIDHYGSDRQMANELADYLRGAQQDLPVSAIDALEAGISAMAIDEARLTGQIVDLTATWQRLDAMDLRAPVLVSHAV